MPHVTIEYSANVSDHHDVDALVAAVHSAGLDHGLPPADGLRTRAARRTHYLVADGDPTYAFIAIHVRIGPGRDADTKQSFLTALLDAAEARVATEATTGGLNIMWSIELNEIDPATRINRNHVRPHMAAKLEET